MGWMNEEENTGLKRNVRLEGDERRLDRGKPVNRKEDHGE